MAKEEPATRPGANPISILQGAMGAAAMKAALDLEIFTHIANGADTADKIAAAKHLPVRSTRILCDALVALGVLGVLEDASHALGMAFRTEGDIVLLLDGLGENAATAAGDAVSFSSSEYSKTICGFVGGLPPAVDLAAEKRLIRLLEAAARGNAIASAHDVSDGGLAITLAECCTASENFSVEAKVEGAMPAEHACFGERGARAVVSCDAGRVARVRALASQYGVRAEEIGRVGRSAFRVVCGETVVVNATMEIVRETWGGALKHLLESETSGA